MKKLGKILIIGTIIFLLTTGLVISNEMDFTSLQRTLGLFSEDMVRSMPFNSAIGLNWSDAYIGQFLGIPPNFGVGMTFGVSSMDNGPINDLVRMFSGEPLNDKDALSLPGYTFEGRLGGFIIPFDIGFKIGFLPEEVPILEAITGLKLSYFLVGGDFRYALVNTRIFRLSAGLGFNHLNGGISLPIDSGFGPLVTPDGYKMTMSNPEAGLLWNTNCLEFKLQASISTPVVTPYAGFGLNYSWTKAGYDIASELTMKDSEGNRIDANQFIEELNRHGITDIRFTDKGIESILSDSALNMRVYGGFSLNMTVIRLDLTGMYDLFNSNLGLTVGIRFQAKSIL